VDPDTGRILGESPPNSVWRIVQVGDRYVAEGAGRSVESPRLVAMAEAGGFVAVGTKPDTLRRYRGHLEWTIREGKLLTINWVRFDDYLKAVLPREMPVRFHLETLKAQAIAVRSFTFRRLNRFREWGYDLCDHAPCQVYGGVDAEHPLTNQAVDATESTVLWVAGQVLDAVYSSSCGGHTAPIEVVMPGARALPPLRGAPDAPPRGQPYCRIAPNWRWELELTQERLQSLFPRLGKVTAIEVVQRAPSQHVQMLRLRGQRATMVLSGAEFRNQLGTTVVRSPRFEVQPTRQGWKLTGQGYGHGAGLCQWGAQGRALEGQDFRQILSAYYQGTELRRL
ncbi:MAG: SpoIID/LytB domain-containing protein, partial [Fimbriimonadales bacterium]